MSTEASESSWSSVPDADEAPGTGTSRDEISPAPGRWSSPWSEKGIGRATPVVSLALVIALWELVVVLFGIKSYILPSPVSVAHAIWTTNGTLLSNLAVTLREVAEGFGAAVVIGVGVAIMIVESRWLEQLIYPLLVTTNAVPKIALAPIFLAWFGLGTVPRVVVAALLAVFPIVINTAVGLGGVDRGLLLLARASRATKAKTFWHVRVPAALPSILGGFKIGVTLAVTGAVVGEFVGGNSGLGYIVMTAQGNLNMPLAFAAVVILALLGVILFYIVDIVEKRTLRWT